MVEEQTHSKKHERMIQSEETGQKLRTRARESWKTGKEKDGEEKETTEALKTKLLKESAQTQIAIKTVTSPS